MAIDTAEKRRSAAGVGAIPLGPDVTPNAARDQEWRQEATWSYSGIEASEAAYTAGAVLVRLGTSQSFATANDVVLGSGVG